MNKRGQASTNAFEDVFTILPYLFFAGLLFFIVFFIVGQMKGDVSDALNSAGNTTVFNTTEMMDKTSGGIGLFNSLFPLLLIGLIAMVIVSASFMGSHPVFFFVSLIMLVVMIILSMVFSNVYQQITTDANFGTTDDSFNIVHIFMRYLPVVAFLIVIIVFIVIYSQSGGRSAGGI